VQGADVVPRIIDNGKIAIAGQTQLGLLYADRCCGAVSPCTHTGNIINGRIVHGERDFPADRLAIDSRGFAAAR
jgi:hypothetical protein